jgi:hypothetical protein
VVAQAKVGFDGSDALLGFSGTGWTQAAGPVSLQVWVDGQPLGGQLSVYANAPQMHMSLGHTWIHAPGFEDGWHQVTVVAGNSTITDQNDRVNLTLLHLSDGLALRATADEPCPAGTGQVLLTERFGVKGGPFLIAASGSGWVTAANSLVQTTMLLDGADGLMGEVYANNANQHLATVPVATYYPNQSGSRGEYELQLKAQPATSTDQGDTAHLTAIEWVNPAEAPTVLVLNPHLMDTVANTQDGGEFIAQTRFQSGGGTLLFSISFSAWSYTANSQMGASIVIDNKPIGYVGMYANPSSTHLAVPTQDFVVTGVPAGQHVFGLQSGAATYTDLNDRVSVVAMEFPRDAGAAY